MSLSAAKGVASWPHAHHFVLGVPPVPNSPFPLPNSFFRLPLSPKPSLDSKGEHPNNASGSVLPVAAAGHAFGSSF